MSQIETTTLDKLAERFDAFLIDQYGVLHDGREPYPGAVEALDALKRTGKKILLISNSGKRSAVNESRLYRLGFSPGSFDVFLTSGEVAWNRLQDSLIGKSIPRHAKCLIFTSDGNKSAIDGLDLELVEDGTAADILLISGSRGEVLGMDHYEALIRPAAARGVPAICTNPDKLMVSPDGLQFGAGAIAERYTQMGGQVTWIGKPYPDIYTQALTAIGRPDPARVLCIGDSVEHDIAGGNNAGCQTALISSGILKDMDNQQLEAVFKQHDARPNFVVPRFAWATE